MLQMEPFNSSCHLFVVKLSVTEQQSEDAARTLTFDRLVGLQILVEMIDFSHQ